MTKSKDEEEEEHEAFIRNQKIDSILLTAEESFQRKRKGQRVSYNERVYLYKQMKKSKKSFAEIAIQINISLGTLYNIRKELDAPANRFTWMKSITSRNLIESLKIQNIVRTYLKSTKIPLSSKDVKVEINAKTGIAIQS